MVTTTKRGPGWSIVSFIGWHNSGKTTLLRKVAAEFRKRGLQVAVFKSTKHEASQIYPQQEGSDTSLFLKDGIEEVAIATSDRILLDIKRQRLTASEMAFRLFPHSDIVLAEGFKKDPSVPKIVVTLQPDTGGAGETDSLQSLFAESCNIIAVALPSPKERNYQKVPCLDVDRPREIADFIERTVRGGNGDAVSLWADGKSIPLNRFVKAALQGTMAGFIKSLKGTETAQEATLRLKLK